MKNFFLVILTVAVFGCKGEVKREDNAAIHNKEQSVQRAQNAASKGFSELDCELKGTCDIKSTVPSGNQTYDRSNTVANSVFNELSCEVGSNNCDTDTINEATTEPEKIEDKKNPLNISNKSLDRTTKYPVGKDGYPVWVDNPYYEGYYGAVGVSKHQPRGYSVQKRVAVSSAQAELSRSISVLVKEETLTETLATKSYVLKKFNTKSVQESKNIIKNSLVLDEWIDEKTKELYVWVVIPK